MNNEPSLELQVAVVKDAAARAAVTYNEAMMLQPEGDYRTQNIKRRAEHLDAAWRTLDRMLTAGQGADTK